MYDIHGCACVRAGNDHFKSANQIWSLNSMVCIEFNELTGRIEEEENFEIH
jgi:hypothetical protein